MKAAVKIPVIGNGDVLTPQDAVRMVQETGCDAVMIGRAASSNPWIFRQIADYIATGTYETPSETARYEIMRRYYSMLLDYQAPDAVGKMKQFATYFTHGVGTGRSFAPTSTTPPIPRESSTWWTPSLNAS